MPSPASGTIRFAVAETVTPSDPNLRSGRSYVSFPAAVIAGLLALTAVGVWGVWLGIDVDQLLWLIGVLCVFLAAIVFAVLLSVFKEKEQSEPYHVTFDGERVRFQRGQRWIHAPIREMKWFEGKTNHALATRELPLRHKCLILFFPTGFSVGCGLSPESRVQWTCALQEAECEQLINLEGFHGIVLGVLQIAMIPCGGYCGYQIGTKIDLAVAGFKWLQVLAGSFAPAVCIAGFWVGCTLLPLAVPGWRRDTSEERDHWRTATIAIPLKLAIPLLVKPPQAALPVVFSLITVASLMAMTLAFFCKGRSLAERGCETNFDDSLPISRAKNAFAADKIS